jgi:hypothetical protein
MWKFKRTENTIQLRTEDVKKMVVLDPVTHSGVAALLERHKLRQYTLPEIISKATSIWNSNNVDWRNIDGCVIWLRDDEKLLPYGRYEVTNPNTGEYRSMPLGTIKSGFELNVSNYYGTKPSFVRITVETHEKAHLFYNSVRYYCTVELCKHNGHMWAAVAAEKQEAVGLGLGA